MKTFQALIAFIIFAQLTASCSTSHFGKTRKIASIEIPPACQMNLPNPVTKIIHTSTNNGKSVQTELSNTAVTISCRNGKPVYGLEFASTKYGNSTFATELLPSGGYHSGLYSNERGLYAQPNTSKVGSGLVSSYNIQGEINTIRIQLDPAAEKRHKEFCEKTARAIEISEPTTHKDAYSCQARLLPRSPIANINLLGLGEQTKTSFVCFDGKPRYKVAIEVPNSSEVEFFDFGISDGIAASTIYYRRYDKTYSGVESLVQEKKGEHKINIFESGTIGLRLKNNKLLRVNFDKEMMSKHQEWCTIGQQTLSYATPPTTDAAAPEATGSDDTIVPSFIEN